MTVEKVVEFVGLFMIYGMSIGIASILFYKLVSKRNGEGKNRDC